MLGLGLSITLGGVVALSAAAKLAKAFKARVEADGGTVESMACLTTDLTYLTNNPNAPAGYSVDFSSATVGSSADFIISGANIIGYSYTYAVTDSQATEVTGTGVIDSNADTITADLSTLVDGTVTVAVYLSGAGGDGLVVTDTATLSGIDADYQAVLDYATTQGYTAPSASQQTLQNTLVTDLKTAGVWSKLDVFYVFATDGDSDFATLNWKAPSSFQATKVNSPTFTADGGFTGNGSSSYLNTNFDPNASGVNYTLNDASISIWNNNYVANNFITGVATNTYNCVRMSASSANQRINMGSNGVFTPVVNFSDSSKNLRQLNRTSSTNVTAFIDTTSTTHTANSTAIIQETQTILRARIFYSSTEVAFFGMGASLVSENADFYGALNTYKSAL